MPIKPIFGTVLVKRKTNERPTDWELRLRPICQKIRVVEKLLGGPHLLIPGSHSVAVRIYSVDDASRLEGHPASTGDGEDHDGEDLDGIDGLRSFRDSYEYSIVFFILTTGQQQRDQLGRRDSFVNTAQKALLLRANENGGGKKKRTTRTAIVSDISQVIQTIESFVQSLSQDKREKRSKYFAHIANKNFLPGAGVQPTNEAIANHVTNAFNNWAERFEMIEGDSNVVLDMLRSLGQVATGDATTLDDVPIHNSSKELLSQFFGANIMNSTSNVPVQEDKIETANDDEFFDNIEDSELMDCPDPTIQNQRRQTNHQTPFPTQNFQTATSQPLVQNHLDFTPMAPSRLDEHPEYNAAPSVFPGSFNQQGHYSHSRNTGTFQQQMASDGHGYSSNYPNQYHGAGTLGCEGILQQQISPPPESRGGNNFNPFPNGNGNMQGYQDSNQGYGGYASYERSGGYHPHQQFM